MSLKEQFKYAGNLVLQVCLSQPVSYACSDHGRSNQQHTVLVDSSSLPSTAKRSDTIEYAEKITADAKLPPQANGPLTTEERSWLTSVDIKAQSKIYHRMDVR